MKKLGDTAGISANPIADAPGLPVVVKTQSLVDKYPLSYMELRAQVQAARPGTKPFQIDRIIRDFKIKENPDYATYNFRTKALRQQFEKHKTAGKATTVIYNSEAVRFIVAQIDAQSSRNSVNPSL